MLSSILLSLLSVYACLEGSGNCKFDGNIFTNTYDETRVFRQRSRQSALLNFLTKNFLVDDSCISMIEKFG